jgi:hypothetical protein
VFTRQPNAIWRVVNRKLVHPEKRGVPSNGCWYGPSGGSGKPAGAPLQVSPLWLLDHYLTQEDRRTCWKASNVCAPRGGHIQLADLLPAFSTSANRHDHVRTVAAAVLVLGMRLSRKARTRGR